MTLIHPLTFLLLAFSRLTLSTSDPATEAIDSFKRNNSPNRWAWNINPDLKNPSCGVAQQVIVNLKDLPDDVTSLKNRKGCTLLNDHFDFLNTKESPIVDLILRCNPRDEIQDMGSARTKVYFTFQNGTADATINEVSEDHQEIWGHVAVTDNLTGVVAQVDLPLVAKVSMHAKQGKVGSYDVKYQYIYCY